MCEFCRQPDEKHLILEIRELDYLPELKYENAVGALTKALGYDSERQQKEVSPFKAVRDLESESKDRVEKLLIKLYNSISTQWIETEKAASDPFVLNQRIFINPKTGKPLTKQQWAIIKKDILRVFRYIYAPEEERIAIHALALGKVLKGMSINDSLSMGYKSIQSAVDDTMSKLEGPLWRNTVTFAQQDAATLITDVTQRQYRKLHDVIQTGIKDRVSHRELREKLFDNFGAMNRDWRRIAETEIGNNQNTGQLLTELERAKPDEAVFVKGVSSSEACPFCKTKVDNKIFAVLKEPPDSGETVEIKGKEYTAIWPGKSNYGRSRAGWWVAAGTQHPHCILPDNEVSTGLVSSVFKSFYEGQVVEIVLSDGRRLTVTENHPILTSTGFVSAKYVDESTEVISEIPGDRVMESVNPDYYQKPIAIDDLYRAALHSSRLLSVIMPVSPKDFYGDAERIDGNVNVVNAYGLLGGGIEAHLLKYRHYLSLSGVDTGMVFPPDSFGHDLFSGDGSTPTGSIRFLDKAFSLFNRGSGHSGSEALRSIPKSDAAFDQAVFEGVPTHTEFSRQFIHRFSTEVPLDDALFETRKLISCAVIHVRSFPYSGIVYDLTDDTYGVYTCNGVIVKNCRCTWVKYIPGFEDIEKRFRESMEEAMKEGEKKRKKK